MCNHYRQAILRGAIIPGWSIDQFSEIKIPIRFGNMPADVYPDREGLVLHLDEGGTPVIEAMRWGFPPVQGSFVTNLRNPDRPYWKPWLGVQHRCLVPVTAFAEPDPEKPKPRAERWFARPDRSQFFFAGLWRHLEGDRGPKSKPVAGPHRIFTFLTTTPNDLVKPIHPKAMPVVIDPADMETWLKAPAQEALQLQRPAPDGALVLLNRGEMEQPA